MSLNPRLPIVSLFFSLLVATCSAYGETVQLTNGDILHGKVISLDEQQLKLESESFGELTIQRATVATIHLRDRTSAMPAPQPADRRRSPLQRFQSPEQVLEQLRKDGGISAEDMKAVQRQVPLLATPEVKNYVGERLSGLLSGKLSVLDIREEAIDAVDQIKDLQKDLGPQASALNGYLSILEHFIEQTTPPSEAKEKEAPAKDSSRN